MLSCCISFYSDKPVYIANLLKPKHFRVHGSESPYFRSTSLSTSFHESMRLDTQKPTFDLICVNILISVFQIRAPVLEDQTLKIKCLSFPFLSFPSFPFLSFPFLGRPYPVCLFVDYFIRPLVRFVILSFSKSSFDFPPVVSITRVAKV